MIDHESERVLRYEILAMVHRYAVLTGCDASGNVFDWTRDMIADRMAPALIAESTARLARIEATRG